MEKLFKVFSLTYAQSIAAAGLQLFPSIQPGKFRPVPSRYETQNELCQQPQAFTLGFSRKL